MSLTIKGILLLVLFGGVAILGVGWYFLVACVWSFILLVCADLARTWYFNTNKTNDTDSSNIELEAR
jgi:hypothetical protein